ncbi:hypothetical protein BJY01DRAFT_256025 [Aspergillus pseudoustus]|uniref:Uncharacterized protein n=1 Tax=Aspergillus pseudoustus TaxID=1810923 RepID=A0ABR4IF55_9EURO
MPAAGPLTIYIASIQCTISEPTTQWSLILAPNRNKDCIFCDITLFPDNKYAPLTIRRGETLTLPFLIEGKIVHMNKVCTVPGSKSQAVINEAHYAIHGSQLWTQSFLSALEKEKIAPKGTVADYENLANADRRLPKGVKVLTLGK